MSRFIFIILTLSLSLAYGQQQKLSKLLGSDFQTIASRKTVPYMETNSACTIIPSATLNGDTSGIVYQNEFMLFRNYNDASLNVSKSQFSYLKTTFVSNVEFISFQNWLRDSLARERIYVGTEDRGIGATYLKLSHDELKNRYIVDHKKYQENRELYPLNWDTKFSYTDPDLMPLLADMYLPVSERFYHKREINERKLFYKYEETVTNPTKKFNQLDFYTSALMCQDFWANRSTSINDEFSVLGQVYDQLLPTLPAIGLTGMQTNAFCHWKQVQLQKQLDEEGLPYRVQVTLPLVTEIPKDQDFSIKVPTKDYTLNWKITVQDYQTFLKTVNDSTRMEILYAVLKELDAAKLLQVNKPYYYDEINQAMIEFDPANKRNNREIFPFSSYSSISKKNKQILNDYLAKYQYGVLDDFKYYRIDIHNKSIVGKLALNKARFNNERSDNQTLYVSEIDSITEEPVGMDLNLDYINHLGQGVGVRSHENYQRFIIPERIKITPTMHMENQQPADLIKGITYQQALAYYHWKYLIWKAQIGDDWQDFVYPSEAQFKQTQNGGQIVIPAHELNFPTPTFRYVVTFIPKN